MSSPLDDARRLTEEKFQVRAVDGELRCYFCGERQQHTTDCLSGALPKIVAALEAAEAYIHETEGHRQYVDVVPRIRAYQALVTAMRGEVVPKNPILTGTT